MNEETRLINPNQQDSFNAAKNSEEKIQAAPSNNGKKTAAVVAGVAAGGVVGAAAAVGADHIFGQDENEVSKAEEQAHEPVVHTETVVHHVHEPARHPQPHRAPQHAHQQHPNPNQQTHEAKVAHNVADNHTDNTNGMDNEFMAHNTSGVAAENYQNIVAKPASLVENTETETNSDADVHVLGIEVFENGENEGVIAVLEDRNNGQLAAVVDADADGTIDVLVVDTNTNLRFDAEDSYTDVHDQGYQTMDFVSAYAEEQAAANENTGNDVVSTSYEQVEVYAEPDYSSEQNYEEPSYDQTSYEEQDYMQEAYVPQEDYSNDYASDADTGFYEA